MNDQNRKAVQVRLEALGFEVRTIPEMSNSLQPDLIAQSEGATMYVEVKTRSKDNVLRGGMETVRIGETANIFTDLNKHNSISAEVEHASRQLGAVASERDFRLLWYRADRGPFVNNTMEQIGSTLYGIRTVLAERPPFELRPWQCAYAGYADFFRFREIDGVMVEVDGLITLLLSPYSTRRDAFVTSRIARVLAADDAVFDIQRAIADGKMFAASGDAPRRNDTELLVHLKTKYSSCTFVRFLPSVAVTTVITIDGSKRVSNTPLQPPAEKSGS